MAPEPVSGAAAYKKKDGTLALSKDQRTITWTPKAGPAGSFTIQVANITNLQQTPVSNPKVMLKIFSQQQSTAPADKTASETPVQYIFSFTSPTNARPEADAIKEALSVAIQAVKAAQAPETSSSAAAKTVDDAARLGDSQLKSDAELQQTLLKSDPDLMRVFMESLRTKPDSVTNGQFVSQFWSTRTHLLRAHAIERSQTRGSYNVLSSLKPRVEDNVTRLNISKEQIQLIFNQHPLVKKVYDENVPKLTEAQFWSRFFQSRLFKKLRGERITESDATDSLLDKYLRADEHSGRSAPTDHVPHIIDLEGNEENHSQRLGNRPNFDMRPTPLDKVPIIRTLNSLSEKIMGNVAPADRNPTNLGDVDAETFNELQLRDLRGDDEQSRIMLNIRDQSRFFTEAKQAETEESRIYAEQDPAVIIGALRKDINSTYRDSDKQGISLTKLVEPEEDDDSSDDEEVTKPRKQAVGSKSSLAVATVQIFEAIRQRKIQGESDLSSDTCGLSVAVYDRLTLTHATTTEFLNQFWQTFLSGDPDRVGEVASLVESLNRAMDRIKAVADEAESERRVEVDKLKKHAREVMASTGKNIRPNLKGVGGGEKVVNQLMAPTIKALGKAMAEYKKAFEQQTNEARLRDAYFRILYRNTFFGLFVASVRHLARASGTCKLAASKEDNKTQDKIEVHPLPAALFQLTCNDPECQIGSAALTSLKPVQPDRWHGSRWPIKTATAKMLSSGFTNAPITKYGLLFIVISSIGVSVADVKYLFYIHVVPHLWRYGQLWRMLIWQFCYSNSAEVLEACMVLYSLRVIERSWGSRKFASFILSTLPFTTLLPPFILAMFIRPLSLGSLNYLPAGPTAILFAILAQYHAAIPTTYKYQIALSDPSSTSTSTSSPPSITFSDKTTIYFLAFQLSLSQFPHSILPAFIGWVIGYAWRTEMLPTRIYSWRIPGWVYGGSPMDNRQGIWARGGGAGDSSGGVGAASGSEAERFEGLRRRLEGESRAAAAAASATAGSSGGSGGNGAAGGSGGEESNQPLAGQILDRFRGGF